MRIHTYLPHLRKALPNNDTFCLAFDLLSWWERQGCGGTFKVDFALARSFGYTGTDKTFRKHLANLVDKGIITLNKSTKFEQYLTFCAELETVTNTVCAQNDTLETVTFTVSPQEPPVETVTNTVLTLINKTETVTNTVSTPILLVSKNINCANAIRNGNVYRLSTDPQPKITKLKKLHKIPRPYYTNKSLITKYTQYDSESCIKNHPYFKINFKIRGKKVLQNIANQTENQTFKPETQKLRTQNTLFETPKTGITETKQKSKKEQKLTVCAKLKNGTNLPPPQALSKPSETTLILNETTQVDTQYHNEPKTPQNANKQAKKRNGEIQDCLHPALFEIWHRWVMLCTDGMKPKDGGKMAASLKTIALKIRTFVQANWDKWQSEGQFSNDISKFSTILVDSCGNMKNSYIFAIDIADPDILNWQKELLQNAENKQIVKVFAQTLSTMCKMDSYNVRNRTSITYIANNLETIFANIKIIQNGNNNGNYRQQSKPVTINELRESSDRRKQNLEKKYANKNRKL